jgi:hypothetical protein
MIKPYQHTQNLSLIIQPGDSFFPIVDAIDGARQTIRLTIFRMDDPIVRDALSRAVTRGVSVRRHRSRRHRRAGRSETRNWSRTEEVGVPCAHQRRRKSNIALPL